MRRFILLAAALLLCAPLAAQQGPLDGKWWKRPFVARQLELTPDQSAQLEKIFARTKPHLIDLRADLEKKQFAYEQAMAEEQVDRKTVERLIESRENARAALQKELSLMELDMKQVLRPEQRERLQQMRENARRLIQQRRRKLQEELQDEPPPKPNRRQR